MSFRFNFGDRETGENPCPSKEDTIWLESEEILPSTKQVEELEDIVTHAKMFTCGELEIGHIIVTSDLIQNTKRETYHNSNLAKEQYSDLVPGKYEGGLKIWECTKDLIEYLLEHEQEINFKNVQVLDLGCGAGILGIYAFLKGANITFQDYNKEVLENVTIPNVLLNIEEEDKKLEDMKKCNFFSGDWASFNKNLNEKMIYDLIFTSETIYNEDNYGKLIEIFKKRLSPKGTIYVAAKTCYFGVGGGMRQFEKSINESNLFKHEICWKNINGIQREILKIIRKD